MELGTQPLVEIVQNRKSSAAGDIVRTCVARASAFRSGLPLKDDLTILALERIQGLP